MAACSPEYGIQTTRRLALGTAPEGYLAGNPSLWPGNVIVSISALNRFEFFHVHRNPSVDADDTTGCRRWFIGPQFAADRTSVSNHARNQEGPPMTQGMTRWESPAPIRYP